MASAVSLSSITTLFTSLFTPSKSSAHPPPPPFLLSVSTPAKPPPQVVSLSSDVLSVVWPSLSCANTLFFKSAYNVQVMVEENEPEEKLLNRFRREVIKAGVIQECKRRRFFENKQATKKRKARDAAKRNRRRRFIPRVDPMEKQDLAKSKKEDEDKDNWELPDGPLPY